MAKTDKEFKNPVAPKKATGKSKAKVKAPKAPKMVVLTSGNDSLLEVNINGKAYSGKSIEVDPRDVKNVIRVLKEAGAVLK